MMNNTLNCSPLTKISVKTFSHHSTYHIESDFIFFSISHIPRFTSKHPVRSNMSLLQASPVEAFENCASQCNGILKLHVGDTRESPVAKS